jgi:hypothetical protein
MSAISRASAQPGAVRRWAPCQAHAPRLPLAPLHLRQHQLRRVALLTCASTKQKETKAAQLSKQQGGDGGDKEPGWGLFDWQAYNQGWQVPWGPGAAPRRRGPAPRSAGAR